MSYYSDLTELCFLYLDCIAKGYVIDDSDQALIHKYIAETLQLEYNNKELKEILDNLDFYIWLDYKMPYNDEELLKKAGRLTELLLLRFPTQTPPRQ